MSKNKQSKQEKEKFSKLDKDKNGTLSVKELAGTK